MLEILNIKTKNAFDFGPYKSRSEITEMNNCIPMRTYTRLGFPMPLPTPTVTSAVLPCPILLRKQHKDKEG